MQAFVREAEDIVGDLLGVQAVVAPVELAQRAAEEFFNPCHPLVDVVAAQHPAQRLLRPQHASAVGVIQADDESRPPAG